MKRLKGNITRILAEQGITPKFIENEDYIELGQICDYYAFIELSNNEVLFLSHLEEGLLKYYDLISMVLFPDARTWKHILMIGCSDGA